MRSIDRFVELGELRRELTPFYSSTGRPSVDPELIIRMLIVGYCFGIRSERRLCEEVHLNLAYRWFCRLGLNCPVPDHSTFSKNRHGRFRQSDLLRRLFETVLQRCIREGLVGGEGFAVDASLIQGGRQPTEGHSRVRRAFRLRPRVGQSRSIYSVLDDAAFGAATEVRPKFISPSDPAARWTGAHGGQAFFGYSTNYLIDVENAIIVDVEATTAIRQAEVLAAKRMIERSMQRFGLYPAKLMGDSAYGSAEMLGWLVHEHGIEPHVTVFDKSARKDGTFAREDFTYDRAGDVYICPGGKTLTTTGTQVNDGATMLSLSDEQERLCGLCLQRLAAVRTTSFARCHARSTKALATWPARSHDRGKAASRGACARKSRCCSRTSNASCLKLDRLRLRRGPNGAHDEFLLAATARDTSGS